VNVVVSALSDEQPESPQLAVPRGFSVRGPNIGTSQQISIVNGRMQRRIGLNATWQLVPSRAGTFTVGPATVSTSQGPATGNPVGLRVVPAGTLPKRQQRRRSPFDLFDDDDLLNRPGRSLFDDLFQQDPRFNTEPEAPDEYRVQAAPDPTAFLVARVSAPKVVIGEQVTLSVYAYGSRGPFNESNPSEARHANFFSIPLKDRTGREPVYVTRIGDTSFHTMKLREVALFPLSAGRHEIGPMKVHFYGNQYLSRQFPEGLPRESLPQYVEVVEPPLAGRPSGYVLGDVGDYSLEAQVEPRRVEAGGALSVTVTLAGSGNVPTQLQTPDQTGVEWLSPTITDQVSGQDHRVVGRRVFSYVLRFEQAGEFQLGQVKLPFYDPARGAYKTASAELGTVSVVAGPASAARAEASKASPSRPRLSTLAAVREPKEYTLVALWTEHLAYWLALGGVPLSVVVAQSSGALWRRSRSRRRRRVASADQLAKAALQAATQAQLRGDSKDMLGALERSILLALEGACGVKGRAVLREALPSALQNAGLAEELANRVASALQDIDNLRFGDAGNQDRASALIAEIDSLLKQLSKHGDS
jgi:hypothetical protein